VTLPYWNSIGWTSFSFPPFSSGVLQIFPANDKFSQRTRNFDPVDTSYGTLSTNTALGKTNVSSSSRTMQIFSATWRQLPANLGQESFLRDTSIGTGGTLASLATTERSGDDCHRTHLADLHGWNQNSPYPAPFLASSIWHAGSGTIPVNSHAFDISPQIKQRNN
jgi:hypothetical protein